MWGTKQQHTRNKATKARTNNQQPPIDEPTAQVWPSKLRSTAVAAAAAAAACLSQIKYAHTDTFNYAHTHTDAYAHTQTRTHIPTHTYIYSHTPEIFSLQQQPADGHLQAPFGPGGL